MTTTIVEPAPAVERYRVGFNTMMTAAIQLRRAEIMIEFPSIRPAAPGPVDTAAIQAFWATPTPAPEPEAIGNLVGDGHTVRTHRRPFAHELRIRFALRPGRATGRGKHEMTRPRSARKDKRKRKSK